jgi:ketosteroid isomerase-like protein
MHVSDQSERWAMALKIAQAPAPAGQSDAEACRDIIHKYCYFIDSQNSEKLRTIFADDVELEYPTYHERYKGIDEVLGIYQKQASKPYFLDTMAHRLSNELVSVSEGGQEAHATAYYFGSVVQTTGELRQFAGLYMFHMRKLAGTWKVVDYKIDRQWDGTAGTASPRGPAHGLPFDGALLKKSQPSGTR